MNKRHLLIMCGVIVTLACNRTSDDLSGTYVTESTNEFIILNDTLIIKPYNQDARNYQIEKRSGYHRLRNGKKLPKEFKQKSWTATYNAEKQALQETEYGRQIYVNTKAGTLSFGATYRKIN